VAMFLREKHYMATRAWTMALATPIVNPPEPLTTSHSF
jgi:hypothetical protein